MGVKKIKLWTRKRQLLVRSFLTWRNLNLSKNPHVNAEIGLHVGGLEGCSIEFCGLFDTSIFVDLPNNYKAVCFSYLGLPEVREELLKQSIITGQINTVYIAQYSQVVLILIRVRLTIGSFKTIIVLLILNTNNSVRWTNTHTHS